MNPRVSRSSALASQGDRLPDREDRRQARGRLHARRDPQRHHARDAGLLRADDRLRGDQDPALHVREVSRRGRRPRPADEIGRRGDGDRPHVQGVAAEGAALAGDRFVGPRKPSGRACATTAALADVRARSHDCPTASGSGTSPTRCGSASSREEIYELSKIDPWFLDAIAEIVATEERESTSDDRSTPELHARGQGAGLLRSPHRGAARRRRS